MTLLESAKQGQITDTIQAAARFENVSPELLAGELALGRAVIAANKIHLSGCLKPMAIGRIVSTKINANLGASSVHFSLDDERAKLQLALTTGADAVMDLSTGGNLDEIRQMFIAESPVPVGTVPMYEMIVDRDVESLTVDYMLNIIAKQAAQGVDFFTIHAGILREYLPLTLKRVCGIVSRGGALLAKWMVYHQRQNPLYEHFDDICAIMKEYDVTFSLGDGLRPGALADASDQAQLSELRTLGELTQRAQEAGCQVIVEGPGHVPLDQIEYNMKLEQEICKGAPFYVLGPLVTDIGAGYDHISAAIGATLAAYYGASFLCYVTPTEHLGLPDSEAVRTGVIAFKIAAHAADIARGLPGARDRDDKMSKARAALDWPAMFSLALDGQKAKQIRERDECPGNDYCSMCGKKWCAIRINNEMKMLMESKR
ncbi:MAG: phosphomethylpyrimidine synthase ThiC [Phycisphaerae bacterium]